MAEIIDDWSDSGDRPWVAKGDFDAKGDLLVATADDTYVRVPAGSDGQVLEARSSEAAGVRWVEPPEGEGGDCPPNTQAVVTPALVLSQRFTVDNDQQVEPALAVSQGPTTFRSAQTPALAITQWAEATLVKEQTPALALTQRFTLDGSSTPQAPALNMEQVKYDLNHQSGANVATNDGPDNFTNPTNAQGVRNLVNATRAGQLAAATNANLRLAYANHTAKTDLAISLVELEFYVIQSGTTPNNGGMHLEYRLDGGAWTTLASYVNNQDFTSTPDTYDITTAVGGDWAKLDALETRVRVVLGTGTNLVSVGVDAVERHIVASVTDTL